MVDTDETATRVLDAMLKEKTGRITFVPLNRLKPKPVQIPEVDDIEPLIEQLEYDPRFEKAFQQVFGKTCVCKDLALAAKYARSHDLNTITIEGDKVDRKGALTGGFHDFRRSRMDGINAYKHWNTKFKEENDRSVILKATIGPLEQTITKLAGEIQVASNKRTRILDSREPLSRELSNTLMEKEALSIRISKLQLEISDLETELGTLEARRKSYSEEIGAPLRDSLTPHERSEIATLSKEAEVGKNILLERKSRAAEVCQSTKYSRDTDLLLAQPSEKSD